jgi:hypothetical protein
MLRRYFKDRMWANRTRTIICSGFVID